MKKRNISVLCEILLTIISLIGMFVYIPIMMWHALWGDTMLYVNKTNINIIESYLDLNNKTPKKIIYFNGYGDDVDKYIIYYEDNSMEKYRECDIGTDLGEYIENKGHKRYYYDGMKTIIFVVVFCISKHIGNKIELEDKIEMEKRLLTHI